MEKSKEQLELELVAYERDMEDLKTRFEKLEAENETLRDQSIDYRAEIDSLKEKIVDLEVEISEKHDSDEVEELEERIGELESEIDTLESEASQNEYTFCDETVFIGTPNLQYRYFFEDLCAMSKPFQSMNHFLSYLKR